LANLLLENEIGLKITLKKTLQEKYSEAQRCITYGTTEPMLYVGVKIANI